MLAIASRKVYKKTGPFQAPPSVALSCAFTGCVCPLYSCVHYTHDILTRLVAAAAMMSSQY
jgi:hypothetical protein